ADGIGDPRPGPAAAHDACRGRPGGRHLPLPAGAPQPAHGAGRMIASLRGSPLRVAPGIVVLDVGGVGYQVSATASACRRASGPGEVTLITHLHVREDALQLFG